MSYELWVGEEDFLLTSAGNYRQFWDELAKRGGCPNLLRFTPDKSWAFWNRKEKSVSADWSTFSIEAIEAEVKELLVDPTSSELVLFIAESYADAIKEARDKNLPMRIE